MVRAARWRGNSQSAIRRRSTCTQLTLFRNALGRRTSWIEHSANVYLIDREGRYAGSLPPGTKAERLGEVVRELVQPR
jgi:cytochrome oxidase Cu insertion factor (SCO1/SenC/PrrC family)